MAAIVASRVKRERQLRESKASIDSIQHQRVSPKGRDPSEQDVLQYRTKMMYYRKVGNICNFLVKLLMSLRLLRDSVIRTERKIHFQKILSCY